MTEEFGYTRCFKMAKEINIKYLPKMTEAYNNYTNVAKGIIQNNESLNETRSFTEAAAERLKNGYGSEPGHNNNVAAYLGQLREINEEMKDASRDLNRMLSENQTWFKKTTQKLLETNNDLLRDIKESKKPAEELESELKTLAKDIVDLINNVLPSKIDDIKRFVSKTENKFVTNAYNIKSTIDKMDSVVLRGYRHNVWSDVDSEFLRSKASFFDTEYKM